jgi:hypothetical protein
MRVVIYFYIQENEVPMKCVLSSIVVTPKLHPTLCHIWKYTGLR